MLTHQDDDDWITPEEKVVDYSGLRIQDLSMYVVMDAACLPILLTAICGRLCDRPCWLCSAETANADVEAEKEATKQSFAKKWAVTKPAGNHEFESSDAVIVR